MARSIAEIKKEMGDEFVGNTDIQQKYGIDGSKSFDELFSKVSIESILFYVVASAIWAFEGVLDLFKKEMEQTIASHFVANNAWWWQQMKAFQYGDSLRMNPDTFAFGYDRVDAQKNIIAFCAVREKGVQYGEVLYPTDKDIYLLVAGKSGDAVSPIEADRLASIQQYVEMIRPAGVRASVILANAVPVTFNLTVFYDPLLLDSSGKELSGTRRPASEAIERFVFELNTQNFGGGFNTTRLIDAIQKADGVTDVVINSMSIEGKAVETLFQTFYLQQGYWKLDLTNSSIKHQPQKLIL